MNAMLPPIDKYQRLSRYQISMLVNLATRQSDPLPVRAERIKALTFCTDDVKFQCLKVSKWVNQELYDALFKIYFGEVEKPVELFEPKPEETYNDDEKAPEGLLEGFENVEPTVIEPKEKRKYTRFTDVQNRQFIEDYHSGMTNDKLAEKYGLTKKQVIQKLADFKRRGLLKETTKMKDETKAVQTETKPETISDALTALDEINPEKMPKAFTATGKGFMTTDSGLKLDEEPIVSLLRQKIIEKGLRQFYAEVEITIRPVTPTGMIVAVEE